MKRKDFTSPNNKNGKNVLEQIARRVMLEHGFQPDFSVAALDELAKMRNGNEATNVTVKD